MDVSLYSAPVTERPRRRYLNEYKRQVVEASFQDNTSIAAVERAGGAPIPPAWEWVQYLKDNLLTQ